MFKYPQQVNYNHLGMLHFIHAHHLKLLQSLIVLLISKVRLFKVYLYHSFLPSSLITTLLLGCSSLTNIQISPTSKLQSISSSAFQSCTSLTSITIPSSVTAINSQAFYGCSSLRYVSIPASVNTIGTFKLL